MKKITKRLFALFLAFTMLAGINPTAYAEGKTPTNQPGKPELTKEKNGELKLFQAGYLGKTPELSGKLRGSANTDKAYSAILSCLRSMNTKSVNIQSYNITEEQLITLASKAVNDNAELYYVSPRYSYRLYTKNYRNYYVYDFKFKYTVSKTTKTSMDKKFNAEINKALSVVKSGMSSLETAMALHDYLIERTAYTYSSNENSRVYNAYGALVDGKAVCQGYTLAYNHLLKKKKISTKFVPSKSLNHAWSLVYINKNWYHVDVTWDDADIVGWYGHDNFLISDSARKAVITEELGEPAVWDISTKTGTTYDNYYWRDIIFKFYYNSGKWNYSDSDGNYYEKKRLDTNAADSRILKSGLGNCITASGSNLLFSGANGIYKENNGTIALLHDAGYPVMGLTINGDLVTYNSYTGSIEGDILKNKLKKEVFVWNKTVPVLRSVAASGYNQIKLTWNPCAGKSKEDVVEIYRSTNNKSYTKIATKGFADSSFSDTKIKTGVTYYYKVCQYNKNENKRRYSSVKSTKTLPTSNKITYAKATTYNKATLKWSKSSGAYGYTIYRSTSAKGKYKAIKSTRSTSYANGGLDTGRTYYYKVRPYSKVGSKPVYGSYSGYKAIKPKLATISKASVKKTGRTKAKVSWKKVSGASGYVVYKSTKKSSGYKKIKTTKGSSYTYSKCTRKKRNYFRVRAYRTVRGKRIYSGYRTVSVKM